MDDVIERFEKWMKGTKLTRREFLRRGGTALAAATVGELLLSACTPVKSGLQTEKIPAPEPAYRDEPKSYYSQEVPEQGGGRKAFTDIMVASLRAEGWGDPQIVDAAKKLNEGNSEDVPGEGMVVIVRNKDTDQPEVDVIEGMRLAYKVISENPDRYKTGDMMSGSRDELRRLNNEGKEDPKARNLLQLAQEVVELGAKPTVFWKDTRQACGYSFSSDKDEIYANAHGSGKLVFALKSAK